MKKFMITDNYEANCNILGEAVIGEICHVNRNRDGGGNWTPVGLFFVWKPESVSEGWEEHYKIDYFVREHELAPEREKTGNELVTALIKEGLCTEPLFVTVYISRSVWGRAFGKVYED